MLKRISIINFFNIDCLIQYNIISWVSHIYYYSNYNKLLIFCKNYKIMKFIKYPPCEKYDFFEVWYHLLKYKAISGRGPLFRVLENYLCN